MRFTERHGITSLVLAAGLCLNAGAVFAQWAPYGIPVAPGRPSRQGIIVCASDGQGGFYIAWRDYLDSGADVYLQHITADGYFAPGWGPSALPVAAGPAEETPLRACPDAFGGVIIAWTQRGFDISGYELWAQRLQSNGQVHPAWPVNGVLVAEGEGGVKFIDGAISDDTGGAFIVWENEKDNVSSAFIQHLGPDGLIVEGWPLSGTPPVTSLGQHGVSRVLSDGTGGVLGVVAEYPGPPNRPGTRHRAFRLNADGTRPVDWPAEGILLHQTPSGFDIRKICSDGFGGFYFGWNDNRTSPDPVNPFGYRVYAQHVLEEGRVDPRWPGDGLSVGPGPAGQYDFDIGPDGQGGFFAVWQDFREGNWFTYAQRLRPDGVPAPGWEVEGKRVTTRVDTEIFPLLVPDELGGFFVFWEMEHSNIPHYLRMGENGVIAPGWSSTGVPLSDRSSFHPVAISDGAHGVLVAFERSAEDGSRRVYAQRVYSDGVTSTLPALISSEGAAGSSTLRWSCSDVACVGTKVERRQDEQEWTFAGTPRLVSPGILEFEDTGLAAGRYAYRLAFTIGGIERQTPDAWLEVTGGSALALSGFRPNPAQGAASLSFALPDDRPARLDIVDVKGRVVVSRDVGTLGEGSHILPLASGSRLAAGMYWIRLAHPERTLTTKGLILP